MKCEIKILTPLPVTFAVFTLTFCAGLFGDDADAPVPSGDVKVEFSRSFANREYKTFGVESDDISDSRG